MSDIKQRIKNLLPYDMQDTLKDETSALSILIDVFTTVMGDQNEELESIRALTLGSRCSCIDKIDVKTIEKIELDPEEALVIRLPENTDIQHAIEFRDQVCLTLNTTKILVFIGEMELSRVSLSNHKVHPIYDK